MADEKNDHRDYLVLFSAVRGLRADIDDQAGELRELKASLQGDPDAKEAGIEEHTKDLLLFKTRLERILDPDYTRKGGVLQQHRILWDEREAQERQIERETVPRWQFWTAVVSAIIAGAFAILVTWPQLVDYWEKHNKPTKIEQKIERAKHPRDRYHHYTVTVSSDGSTKTTSP